MSDIDLTADLPAPRDDEPASLRQDIIDELADHLHCALQRELLTGGGRQSPDDMDGDQNSTNREAHASRSPGHSPEEYARQIVLNRFGNPAAIARRLWLDAMKERLMAQKLMTVMVTVAALACVAMVLLMWRTMETARQQQAAMLAEHNAFNARLLQELQSRAATPAAAPGVDGWGPLKIRLVSADGNPVEGKVALEGTAINAGNDNKVSVDKTAGADGSADFGLIPYGNYTMTLTVPAAQESHVETFMLAPGQPSDREVICPDQPRPPASLTFRFNPPPEIRAEDLVYGVNLQIPSRDSVSGRWKFTGPTAYSFLVDATGQVLGTADRTHPMESSFGGGFPSQSRSSQEMVHGLSEKSPPVLRAYTYHLEAVSVFARVKSRDGLPADFPDMAVAGIKHYMFEPDSRNMMFEAQPGENVWDVNLPDWFWQSVIRSFLAEPLTRHVVLPEGMQVLEVPIDARELMTLPSISAMLRGGFFPREAQPSETGVERVDVLVRMPEKLVDGVPLDPPEPPLQTLITSAEIVGTFDRNQILSNAASRSRSGSASTRSGTSLPIPVSLLLTDEQAEAVSLARRKGTLTLSESAAEAHGPTLDHSVLEELEELPDLPTEG